MQEQWVQWKPVNNLSTKYNIDAISDSLDNFKVELTDYNNGKNKVIVTFENSVDAYRTTDETFRLNCINTLDKQYGPDFYGKWTFFKVTNSKYIQWLSEESCTISDSLPLVHFSFIAANCILDVVTTYEPKVELVEK